jgi:hypothetical protein
MGNPMNSSFTFLDRATHLKIVLLAALVAGAVVAVGESAQVGRSAPAPTAPEQAMRSLKALPVPVARPDARQPEAKQPAVVLRDAA